MKVKPFHLLALATLALASWWTANLLWGARGPAYLAVWGIVAWLFVSALVWGARRLSARVWLYAGLANLAGLFLPALTFARVFPARWSPPFDSLMALTLLLILSTALVIAALLLSSGLNLAREARHPAEAEGEGPQAQRKRGGKTALPALALGLLLLAAALRSFYWFMVWDTTNDPLGSMWLAIPALAVLFSSAVLWIVLPGRTRLVGFLYLSLIPALVAISASAQRVDFRRLTEERAGRVAQAIEAYHSRQGRYPQDLRQLTPWYALALPGPVIIYGQDWCYEAGQGYYRLGYVYREHWSDPRLTGRVFSQRGEAPDLQRMCEEQVAALQERYPDYPYEYRIDGE